MAGCVCILSTFLGDEGRGGEIAGLFLCSLRCLTINSYLFRDSDVYVMGVSESGLDGWRSSDADGFHSKNC